MVVSAANRWKLGVFVVLGMGLGFITLLWLGTAGFGERDFRIVSYFNESVQGLDVGSSVKFRGVPIGRVAKIRIAPDGRHVEVMSDVKIDALARLGFRQDATEMLENQQFSDKERHDIISETISPSLTSAATMNCTCRRMSLYT